MSQVSEMNLRRRSTTADAWGRYYTSSHISSVLVNAMVDIKPELILELGAGHGSIASAAYRKWGNARYVTVDTDQAAKVTLIDGLKSSHTHTHHVHDALDDELAEKIGIPLASVDVGLCNPPYVRPQWRASFGRILEEAGLSGALQSVHDAGADLLFIAQNLRLLKRQGKLGLILPDGLITGERYRGVREVLLREHRVDLVVQLPRRVFSRTEAQTYLLVLSKKSGETQAVALSQMNGDGEFSVPIHVPADLAATRLDYSFHALKTTHSLPSKNIQSWRTVGSFLSGIIRGTTSSSQIRSCPFPVFHLSDFPSNNSFTITAVPSRFILPNSKELELHTGYKIARAGDILIARIGRNLQDKVCFLEHGSCIISDCIFALRTVSNGRDALLSYFYSEQGRAALEAASHGVGARYLSRADVLNIMIPF